MSNKAVFLDRDNTLIEDPGYINNPDQVNLLDGVAEAIIELKELGYKLVVVSNQSAVARGIVTEKILTEIHDRLKQLLAEKGAYLDQIYYCPYHPEGVVRKYRKESDWRKPNPGMLLTAAEEMDIDLSKSWMIGDSGLDIEAGLRAGCRTIFIKHSWEYKSAPVGPEASKSHYNAVNLKEATNIIKRYHRSNFGKIASTSTSTTESRASMEVPSDLNLNVEDHRTNGNVESQIQPVPDDQTEIAVQTEQTQRELHPLQPVEPYASTDEGRGTRDEEWSGDRIEYAIGVLNSILEQLKSMQRINMFDEFSIMRLMAGIVQIIALFCLLITVWLLLSPNRQDSTVLIALGFATVLQLMSLTFYRMQSRK
jgi:D-glycero-D-manno-heptose 1,7-bisphosphate phosphatase